MRNIYLRISSVPPYMLYVIDACVWTLFPWLVFPGCYFCRSWSIYSDVQVIIKNSSEFLALLIIEYICP